jgi:tetratricopeptide (TPR) repeat protein
VAVTPDEPRQGPPELVKPPSGGPPATAETQPSGQPPDAPSVPDAPTLEERLSLARQARDEGHFDEAEAYLSSAKDAQGRRPADVTVLLEEVKSERKAGKLLDTARAALDSGKLDEAATALEESKGTRAFLARYTELKAQLDDAQKKAAAAATPPQNTGGNPNAAQNTVQTSATEPAEDPRVEEALVDGKQFIREKKYELAIRKLKECIRIAPTHVECHMYLGGAYAAGGKLEEGAKHYRRFLELAPPDHPRFQYVKSTVENYEATKQK